MKDKNEVLTKATSVESSELPSLDPEGELYQRGLQTANDVLVLTKTRSWNEIFEKIQTEIAEKIKETKEMWQHFQQEQQTKSILSALMDDAETPEKDDSAQLYEELRLNEEAIKRAGTPPPAADKAFESVKENSYAASLETYQKQLENHKIEKKATEQQYAQYNSSLDEVDDEIAEIERHRDAMPEKKAATNVTVLSIKGKISALEATFQDGATEIDRLSRIGDKKSMNQVRTILDDLNAKNLKVASLKDMLAVTEGKKLMFNKEGNQVNTFKEADFIVPSGQKIAKDGNNFYLLKENESLASLSPERKAEAQNDFEQSEQHISGVKRLVGHHFKLSMNDFDKEEKKIAQQIQTLMAQPRPNLTPVPDVSTHRKEIEKMPYPEEPVSVAAFGDSPEVSLDPEDNFNTKLD